MALIPCPECGSEVSDKAPACPKCGVLLASAPTEVLVNVHKKRNQIGSVRCSVSAGGRVIVSGKQGDTLRVPCKGRMEITLAVTGYWFGMPRIVVEPGERYVAKPRNLGYYFEKVDQIAGL